MDTFFEKQRYYIGYSILSFFYRFLNIVDIIWESVTSAVKEKELAIGVTGA